MKSLLRLVCHQAPERILRCNGVFSLLCSRCTGIYSGFSLGILFLFFFRRKASLFPGLRTSILAGFFIFFNIVHPFLASHFAILDSNFLRFAAGFFCGISLALFVYPLFVNVFVARPGNNHSAGNLREFFFYCIILSIAVLLVFAFRTTGLEILNILAIAGLLGIYLMLNATAAGMLLNWRGKRNKPAAFLMLVLYILLFFSIEYIVLSHGK
jgi:uncharacterized membrane protein